VFLHLYYKLFVAAPQGVRTTWCLLELPVVHVRWVPASLLRSLLRVPLTWRHRKSWVAHAQCAGSNWRRPVAIATWQHRRQASTRYGRWSVRRQRAVMKIQQLQWSTCCRLQLYSLSTSPGSYWYIYYPCREGDIVFSRVRLWLFLFVNTITPEQFIIVYVSWDSAWRGPVPTRCHQCIRRWWQWWIWWNMSSQICSCIIIWSKGRTSSKMAV